MALREGSGGVVQATAAPRPSHFREWIDVTFGAGIADVFLVPYNFKVWAHPLEELDYNWIGERVAVTDLTRLLDNIFHEKDDRSWGPNHTFSFPEHGGTGAIWEGVADRVGRAFITLEKDVKSIDPTSRTIVFHDGAATRTTSSFPRCRWIASWISPDSRS